MESKNKNITSFRLFHNRNQFIAVKSKTSCMITKSKHRNIIVNDNLTSLLSTEHKCFLFWLACTLNHIWECVQCIVCAWKEGLWGPGLVRINVLLPPCGQMWRLSSHNPDPTETHQTMSFITPWNVSQTLKLKQQETTYILWWKHIWGKNCLLWMPSMTFFMYLNK